MSAKKEPRRENEQNGSEKTDGMSSSQVPYKNTLLIHLVFTFIRTSQARLNYVGLEAHWSSSSSSLKNGCFILYRHSKIQEREPHTHTQREREKRRERREIIKKDLASSITGSAAKRFQNTKKKKKRGRATVCK